VPQRPTIIVSAKDKIIIPSCPIIMGSPSFIKDCKMVFEATRKLFYRNVRKNSLEELPALGY
jgi:hypothetical protein